MEAALAKIELPPDVQAEFLRRLHSAFNRKTGMALTVLNEEACTHESYWRRFAKAVLMPWRGGGRGGFLGGGGEVGGVAGVPVASFFHLLHEAAFAPARHGLGAPSYRERQ